MDVALKLLDNPTYPSYGYMVNNAHEPSTTLWERWESDATPRDQADASRNHIMYGAISAFFWKHLVGLRPALPGWRRARVAPVPERCEEGDAAGSWRGRGNDGIMDAVDARLGTIGGEFVVQWRLHPARAGEGESSSRLFGLNVTLPVPATVVVPCVPTTGVVAIGEAVAWRDGKVSGQHAGVTSARRLESGGVEFAVAAGDYAFLRA